MLKRQSGCPLCGARMDARDWMATVTGLLDQELGVLAARCPYCQGYLELRPLAGRLEIGYLSGAASPGFQVAMSLPWPGLEAQTGPQGLQLQAPEGRWEFVL